MNLHFDLDLERLVSGPTGRSGAISRLPLMERAKVPVKLHFWRGRVAEAVTGTPEITLGIKGSLADVSFIAAAEDPDWTSTAGGTIWEATLDLATAEMIALVGDLETMRALAQLSIDLDDGSRPKSQPVEVTIFGAVVQGDEGTPTALPTPLDWLAANGISFSAAITGLIGGASTDLDSLATLTRTVGELRAVMIGTGLHVYQLIAATTAEDSPYYVRPDDYATSTNEKVWRLTSLNVPILASSILVIENTANGKTVTIQAGGVTANRVVDLANGAGMITVVKKSSTAPSSAPTSAGIFHVNETTGIIYVSVGEATAADWIPFATTLGHPIGWNADQSKFQKITITGAAGSEVPTISDL